MRGRALAVLVATAWLGPTALAAQGGMGITHAPHVSTRPNPARPAGQFPPSTGQTLPPAGSRPPSGGRGGRPMPTQPGQGLGQTPTDQFLANPWTYAPRYSTWGWRSRGRSGYWYGYAPIGGYIPTYDPTVTGPFDDVPEGRLLLNVTPGSAQVFVDGLYVGTADNFDRRGSGLYLDAGPRRVDLRADGYEPVTFDVRIVPGDTVSYQKDLEREDVQPAAARVVAPPKTFYVIPRCFAGDTLPRADQLPSGCRLANLRTIPPVIGVAKR